MRKQFLAYTLLAGISLTGFACENNTTDASLLNESDLSFLTDAANHGLFQVNAGQAATTNADAANINAFGQTMVSRYANWNQELQSLADGRKVRIANTLDDDRQEMLDSLSARRGAAFDTLYIGMMVQSHTEAIRHFESAPDSVADSDLKDWAGSKISQMRNDLERAKFLQDSIGKTALRRL